MKMSPLLNKMKMKRPLTKNEKLLFVILMVLIIFIVTFRFVITPQASKLQELTEQKWAYEDKISRMNTLLKGEKSIDKEWIGLHNEEAMILNKYFATIDQPEIIYILNNLLNNEEIDILDINFDRPTKEQIGDLTVDSMNIVLPYKGSYDGLVSIIEAINSSPKKMLISNLIMDKNVDGKLVGNISLKVYSLEGLADKKEDTSYIGRIIKTDKSDPFMAYEEYDEVDNMDLENSIEDSSGFSGTNLSEGIPSSVDEGASKDDYNREVLEDFEEEDIYFIPSNKEIKGSISKSNNSKLNKYSLRLEYNILALEDENRAYVDLTDKDIILKYPPASIGIWAYSYSYSPLTLGYRLKGQAGEKIDVELSKGINWLGWQYIEATPPQDLSLYPLQLDRFYLELGYNRDDYGVLLIDKLEAKYRKSNNNNIERFTFYMVESGDTLNKISVKNYGTSSKTNIIKKYNEIKSDKDIWEGKILVIPR